MALLNGSIRFEPGDMLTPKYRIVDKLGEGWEGVVYRITEVGSGIDRAAKLFFPKRNRRNAKSRYYARKLHKLRHCPMVIQYHGIETIEIGDHKITAFISEYVEGEPLPEFLKRQRGQRLQPFPALHLLYQLARGVEIIHAAGEFHGDIHEDNILIERMGLSFELKLFDLYDWKMSRGETIRSDILNMISVFHYVLGGRRHYPNQPQVVKYICCGLRSDLILEKFRTAAALRRHIEHVRW